ncbi:MAG: SH3 domain-containing protein [Fidelibacterota bacterium]
MWHKDFSKKGIEIPRSIVKLNDNNIAIAGFCATETEEFYKVLKNDLHVLKVSPDGNRIWTKTIGLKNIDEAFLDLSVTDDNELFLLGKRKYFNDKLYVIKINKFGNITWQTTHDIGHLIKSARLTNDTSNTGITIHATVLDIGYKTKELFEKEILFALNNNGERRNLEELATKQLEYNFFADIDYQKNQQMVGIIRTNSLNIRRDPSLTSGVVTNLKKGRTVEIIDKSKTKVRINQMNDYWYLLRVDNGETGWAYGHFIDIVE